MKTDNTQYFGKFGGRYVPEMLMPALDELDSTFNKCRVNQSFIQELTDLSRNFTGRPSPLYFAENLSRLANNNRLFLKLESHNHTGAHKINNVLGQALLAREMGKNHLVAETGAGQHGVATAAVAARLGMKCTVFMGEKDMQRQYPNVYNMKLLGAEVIPVKFGSRTLKDAVNAALKHWIENLKETYYLIGSALGPAPYPLIVRYFQSVIGEEVIMQLDEMGEASPDALIACVGGGSNALGLFNPFLEKASVRMYGVEAGGIGNKPGENAVRFGGNSSPGVVQGFKSYFLQNRHGQVLPTHSVSAGLDYPGVSPELAHLSDTGRVAFDSVSDNEALEAYKLLSRTEGIIPALESSHAVAFALKLSQSVAGETFVVNISGRGDKDIFIAAPMTDRDNWYDFLRREVSNV